MGLCELPDRTHASLPLVVVGAAWGVLDLDLYEDSYDWRFVTVDGAVLDNGTSTCIS